MMKPGSRTGINARAKIGIDHRRAGTRAATFFRDLLVAMRAGVHRGRKIMAVI